MEEEVEVTAAVETSPKDRLLNEIIPALGISKNKFVKACGLTYAVLIGRTKGLQQATINKIVKTFPQINKEYLLKGKGEMFVEVVEKPKRQRAQAAEETAVAKTVTALEVIPQAVAPKENLEVALLKQKIADLEDEVKYLRHILELHATREY